MNTVFQTIPQQKWHTKRLFWFLDTGVQCLNTEHQCLNWTTKHAHSLSHSLPFSVSFNLSLSLSLSHTLTPHSTSLYLSISLRLSVSLHRRSFGSVAVLVSVSFCLALSLHHRRLPLRCRRRRCCCCCPKNGLLAMISILTTAGYHSHLISSMWFLGFYIIVWMIVWIVFVF